MERNEKGRFKKGNIPWNNGKKGYKHSEEANRKKSIIAKKNGFGKWMKGKKLSEETKRKIGLKSKGRIMSKETRKKMSLGHIGRKVSKESRKKMSKAKKGKHPSPKTEFKKGHKNKHSEETKRKISKSLTGKKRPEEVRKKLRLATIKYVREVCGGLHPMIGRNEKQLLDEFQEEYGYKVIRQHPIEGYFIDGYVKELNLAIEVDEKPKNKERDIVRQKIIEKKLGCKFLRIKDYD